MIGNIRNGVWFPVNNIVEHTNLKAYGTIYDGFEKGKQPARRQIGEYAGPGQYMVVTTTCHGTFYGIDTNEVLTEAQAVTELRQKMIELFEKLPLGSQVQFLFDLEREPGDAIRGCLTGPPKTTVSIEIQP